MTTTKNSAYTGAATITPANVNGLVNGGYADFGTVNVLDNTTALALFVDFWLTFTLAVASGSGTVDLYLIPFDPNAGAYPAEFDATHPPPATCRAGQFQLQISATTHTSIPSPGATLGPNKYRVVLGDNTGQTFANPANVTLAYDSYSLTNS